MMQYSPYRPGDVRDNTSARLRASAASLQSLRFTFTDVQAVGIGRGGGAGGGAGEKGLGGTTFLDAEKNRQISVLQGRLEELLILEILKDGGGRNYLNLSVRSLYQHVLAAITTKPPTILPAVLEHEKQLKQQHNAKENDQNSNENNQRNSINKSTSRVDESEVIASINEPLGTTIVSEVGVTPDVPPQAHEPFLPLTTKSVPTERQLDTTATPTISFQRQDTISNQPQDPPINTTATTMSTASATQKPRHSPLSHKASSNDSGSSPSYDGTDQSQSAGPDEFSSRKTYTKFQRASLTLLQPDLSLVQKEVSFGDAAAPAYSTTTTGQRSSNNSNNNNITYRERLGSYLHPRDMRKLVTPFSSSNEPQVMVRRHAILLNFDPLRAIILRDRVLVLVPDGADSLLIKLEDRIIRGGADGGGRATNTQADLDKIVVVRNTNTTINNNNNNNNNNTEPLEIEAEEEEESSSIVIVGSRTRPSPALRSVQSNLTAATSTASPSATATDTHPRSRVKTHTFMDIIEKTAHRISLKSYIPSAFYNAGDSTKLKGSSNLLTSSIKPPPHIKPRNDQAKMSPKNASSSSSSSSSSGMASDPHDDPNNNNSSNHDQDKDQFSLDINLEWADMKGQEWIQLPFELQCIDAVLQTVLELLADDTLELEQATTTYIRDLLHHEGRSNNNNSRDDPLKVIRAIKDSIRQMSARTKGFVQSMNKILDDYESMALMNLTRLMTHPELFIKPVTAEALEEESDEPELILEYLLQHGLSLVNAIDLMDGQISTAAELVDQKLDAARNKILLANTVITATSLCVNCCIIVSSLFGMNLTNPFEDSDTAFIKVFIGSVGAAVMLFIGTMSLMYRVGALPNWRQGAL